MATKRLKLKAPLAVRRLIGLSLCWAASLAFTLPFGCRGEALDPTGGETHFLRACSLSAECGSSLVCACGMCTLPCDGNSACGELTGAVCVQEGDGSCASETPLSAHGTCEARCSGDAQCEALQSDSACVAGYCRPRLNSPIPDAATQPAPEPDAAAGSVCLDRNAAGSDLLLVGDSFFAVTHDIASELEQLARDNALLGADEHYRDVSRLNANALALGGQGILDQFTGATSQAPAASVVLNGGGADVLLGTCPSGDASCSLISEAAAAARDVLSAMSSNGVKRVVYVFYPNPREASVKDRMDLLRPLIQDACSNSPVPCYWLDLRPVFEGHYDAYIQSDGLNPTAEGSRATAAAIWSALSQSCSASR